jgi:glycosyltransferase involved in cell wall biosynthesis
MTVWYDYTTSLRAVSRNGIATSEWSLGRGLAAARSDVRCFVLGDDDRLVEIEPERDLAQAVYASPDGGLVPFAGSRTWRTLVRAGLTAALGPAAIPVIQSIARARSRFATAARRARTSVAPRARSAELASLTRANDVVVTMGADWDGNLLRAIGTLKAKTGCRVVAMVYDLIPLTHTHLAFHKDRMLFDRYYRRLLEVADVITCISNATRSDLIAFADERGLQMPRCAVLHLGDIDTEAEGIPAATREAFYLWVGTLERRKNLELLHDALRILESEGAQVPTVVVAGQAGWGVGDVLAEISLGSTAASRSLVLLGAVSDSTLESLYTRARALLFPSHYEGWGLPLREAAVRGCPIAVGDTPAAREALVGYSAATFLSTDDPAPWADYLQNTHPAGTPAPPLTWGDSVGSLLSIIDAFSDASSRMPASNERLDGD